jgi:hypothetical protein
MSTNSFFLVYLLIFSSSVGELAAHLVNNNINNCIFDLFVWSSGASIIIAVVGGVLI